MPQAPYTLEQAEEDIADLRGQLAQLPEYAEIATVVAGVVVAVQPGTSTSPQTQEAWHSLGSLGVAGITVNRGRYRMTPDGETEFDIQANATTSVSAATGTFANSLPAAYQPTSLSAYPLIRAATTSSGTTASLIVSGGTVTLNFPALSNGDRIGGSPRMPVN